MCSKNDQSLYSCGHPRPLGPIGALIAHAKPIICPNSQPEALKQTQLPHDTSSLLPTSSSNAVIFNNPFNDPIAPPPPYFSAHSSGRHSLNKAPSSASSSSSVSLERELTPEERVAAGMEYMHAFLASRVRSSATTSSRASSIAPTTEMHMSRRVAVGAA
jgi:hypothetical protein